ncbi:hypothetical protein [Nocardia wallacei]|uniref:hypothetical protein n=1 Tax=Nocardia wallacei TaxID=480035 RepID=UPI002458010D|nr:hypothetical protein [Nocardia wallacei]
MLGVALIDPALVKVMTEAAERMARAFARGSEAADKGIGKFPDTLRLGIRRRLEGDQNGAHAVGSAFEGSTGEQVRPPGEFVAKFDRSDGQVAPLAHVRPSSECLADYETHRARHWSRLAADRGLTVDEFITQADEHAADLVRDSYVCTRVTGSTLFDVIRSGEVKSFFDAGKSSIRDDQLEEYIPSQKALFGYGADLVPEGRPIYGYITRDPLGRDLNGGRLAGYGSVAVVFKPQIAERTTITLNDSLIVATHNDEMKAGMSMAEPLTNPTSNLFRRNEDPFAYQTPESVEPYIEAQIHRLISTPSGTESSPVGVDSIDRVTFLSNRSEYSSELFDALDSLGIPYSFERDPVPNETIGVDVDFV